MNNNIRLSIVTPSYNQGHFIEETILSVRNQNYLNAEHIIMDGASKDNTLEILKKYPHLIYISEPDKGQTNAANKGIKMAKGNIIGWLNSDDVYFENVFFKIESFFMNNPKISAIYGDYCWIDENSRYIKITRENNFNQRRLLFYNFIAHPTVFIRRDVFDKIGFFREDLQFAMDYEFWLRLCKKFSIVHIPLMIAKLRLHSESKTYSHREKQREDFIRITKIHDDLFSKVKESKLPYPLVKKYYMLLRELNELYNSPNFYVKRMVLNCISSLTLNKFKPDYRFQKRY